MRWLRYIIVAVAAGGLAGGTVMFLRLGPPAGGCDDGAVAAIERHLAQLRRNAATLPAPPDKGQEDETAAGLREQVRQLRSDLIWLEAALQDMRLQQERAHGTALSFDESAEEEEIALGFGHDELGEQARMERNREQIRQHFANIETAFRAEQVDQGWSDTVGTKIHDAFSNDGEFSAVTLSNVECRASRCRLEVWYDDDADMDDVEMALTSTMVNDTPRMAVNYEEEPGEDGGTAIIYLARKGHGVVPRREAPPRGP